jgi:hypothetical protein
MFKNNHSKAFLESCQAAFVVAKIMREYLLLLVIFAGLLSLMVGGIAQGAGAAHLVVASFLAVAIVFLGLPVSLFLLLQGLGLRKRYWPPLFQQCRMLRSSLSEAAAKKFKSADPYAEAKAPFVVSLEDFSFRVGCSTIRRVLDEGIMDRCLDENAGEALALELCWAHAPHRESSNTSLRVDSYLREAWLWHRCSLAMGSGYHWTQAQAVVAEKLHHVGVVSSPTAETVCRLQAFLEATTDPELRLDVIDTLRTMFYNLKKLGISTRSRAKLLKKDLRRLVA